MAEEKIEGLPDVDLSAIVADLESNKDKDKKPEVKDEGKPQDWGQFKNRDGSLNQEGLLKSYKEIQAAFTRVSQDNKTTREQLAQMNEQVELARLATIQTPQVNPQTGEEDETIVKYTTMRISETLEEEAEKNKDNLGNVNVSEFNERYAYAQAVSRQYPQLARSARGVKKLFELGDKLRTESLKKNAGKALESIFGGPLTEEENARLVKLIKGDKAIQKTNNLSNAYMPDTSTSTKSGSDQNLSPNSELQIKESVEKGDVDGVISALFKRQLAE